MPYELDCYIILGALILVGAKRHRIILPTATLLLLVYYLAPIVYRTGWVYDSESAFNGPMLVATFLTGVSLFSYRDKIPFSAVGCFVMTIIGAICLSGIPAGFYLAILPLSYVTVYLGVLSPPRIGLIRSADYSYGIFLYGFVVQQAVMALLPWAREWYWNLAIGLPLTVLVEAASWHFVEKPASKLKTQVGALERWWLVQRAKLPWPNFRVEPAE